MKAFFLMVLAGSAIAGPHKKPDKFAVEAAAEFDLATEAEAKHDFKRALAHYDNAFQISPHADTVFNKALVLEQLGREHDALVQYELYLDLAPAASDRAQVEASIKQLASHRKVDIALSDRGASFANAYILVDSDVVAKPGEAKPLSLPVALGRHHVVAITPIGFTSTSFYTSALLRDHWSQIELEMKPRVDGNVVLMLPGTFKLELDGKPLNRDATRVVIPAGPQVLHMFEGTHECAPVTIQAPTGDDRVLVVDVEVTELAAESSPPLATLSRCRAFAVKQQTLSWKP